MIFSIAILCLGGNQVVFQHKLLFRILDRSPNPMRVYIIISHFSYVYWKGTSRHGHNRRPFVEEIFNKVTLFDFDKCWTKIYDSYH